MPRFQLPVIQSFKAPGTDRVVRLRLYNHVYLFTSTVGTQTDSEVFYMNGKPARVVHPFRVVPKKPKEVVDQMADLGLALAGQAVNRNQTLEGAQIMEEWPTPMQLIADQPIEQPQQPEPQEVPVASAFAVRERHSQETQTERELFPEDEADTASASEDSNAE